MCIQNVLSEANGEPVANLRFNAFVKINLINPVGLIFREPVDTRSRRVTTCRPRESATLRQVFKRFREYKRGLIFSLSFGFSLVAASYALRKFGHVGERCEPATSVAAASQTYGDERRGRRQNVENGTGRGHFDTGRSTSRTHFETRLRRRPSLRPLSSNPNSPLRFQQLPGKYAPLLSFNV